MSEALGFIHFYGLTPSIDWFKGSEIDLSDDSKAVNVLLSECADIRHILASLSAAYPLAGDKTKVRAKPITIYLHDKQLENLARALLFLTLICETSLSKRERMELFLDLYSNCMIREKSDAYLQSVLNELIQLVTEDERCHSVLREMVKFDQLKFKDRDEIEDIISAWYSNHPYDIEQLRDTRCRAHFKERYDVRKNIIDWDYTMYVKKWAPLMNNREYMGWRQTGTAFETRLATNNTANRTFSSYVPGRDVSTSTLLLTCVSWAAEKNKGQYNGEGLLG